MLELVSVPFFSIFDTNNLLKNRITSGMHIYSSPRNMSVNLGLLSTKHELHSLPNCLYPQRTGFVCTAFLFLSAMFSGFFIFFNLPYLCQTFD